VLSLIKFNALMSPGMCLPCFNQF